MLGSGLALLVTGKAIGKASSYGRNHYGGTFYFRERKWKERSLDKNVPESSSKK